MTKKQILELTGLSESEFYKKYPTKESFEKDAKNYKKGGIYIKPENRGKFTATKKRTGKTTEELTHSKNPLTRKRAIFAQNAKKWKHAEGGEVKPNNPGFNALPKDVQDKIIKQMSKGGNLNSLNYEVGGKVPKHIAAGLYGVAEGALDTVTMGATDQLTDKGFEWLTKVGNKDIDLNNPDDVQFLKTQQQVRGYSNTAGAVTTGILTGNVWGATGQSAKGLNTAFQASDWAGDDFKKWSNISSGAINTTAKIAGGAGALGATSGGGEGLNQVNEMLGGNITNLLGGNKSAMPGKTNSGLGSSLNSLGVKNTNKIPTNINNTTQPVANTKLQNFNTGFNKAANTSKKVLEQADNIIPSNPNDPLFKQGEDVQKQKEQMKQKSKDQEIIAQKERTGGERYFKKGGELIKRADGSYSRRGLWDNIRANKGSGKKPTKEMLKQEAKIKAQEKSMGGNVYSKGGELLTAGVIGGGTVLLGNELLEKKAMGGSVYADGGKLPKNILKSRLESHMSTEQANAYLKKYAKGGKLEHLGDNLYKVKSHIKGTDKVEVRPNVFFDDKEVVRKNSDGSMQILSDDLGYAKPVEKVAKAMGGKAAQSLFNTMYTKQEMSKAKRPVDKFADNANKRMSYVNGGLNLAVNMFQKNLKDFMNNKKTDLYNPTSFNPIIDVKDNNFDFPIYPTPDFELPKEEPIYPTPDLKKPVINEIKKEDSPSWHPPMSLPPTNPNLYKMDQISPWWLAASEAGNIANLLMSSPDDVNLPRYNYTSYRPTLVDPYRANRLLASELRKQANAASAAIRGTANTQGTYLASEIANRSRLNEAIASQLAQSNLQSILANNEIINKGKAINTDIINKARAANVEIGATEQDLRQREKDAARTIRSQAISQMGTNAMQYGRDRKQVDMTNKMLPFISPEGYQIVTNPDGTPSFKRKSGSGVNNLNFSYTKKSAGEKENEKRFGGKIYKK